MKRVPRGQEGGGRFAPDRSGFVPPTAADQATVRPQASASPAPDSDVSLAHQAFQAGPGARRCGTCGQFTGSVDEHSCLPTMSRRKQGMLTLAPAVAAVGTFATTAAAIALGPVAIAVVAASLLAGLGMRRLLLRTAKKAMWKKAADPHEQLKAQLDMPQFSAAQQQVTELAEQLGVEGEVLIVRKKEGSPAAGRLSADRSVVLVTRELLGLPEDQRRAILAHEIAHLQPRGRWGSRAKSVLASAAFPAAFGIAAVSGLAALPAAGLAAVAWYAGKTASSAASRREERRADRTAYRMCGEAYVEALKKMHARVPGGELRHDLPWRAEDIVFSHGNLPNRLEDMRR